MKSAFHKINVLISEQLLQHFCLFEQRPKCQKVLLHNACPFTLYSLYCTVQYTYIQRSCSFLWYNKSTNQCV